MNTPIIIRQAKRMMKPFSLFIILFSFLFVACNKEEIAPQGEATTFTLAIEQEAAASPAAGKTATSATRATIAPARYIMEVWSENGTVPENVFEGGTTHRAELEASKGSSFSATLDKTKAYTCLFWADDNATFDATDLKAISPKAGKEIADIAYFANIRVEKGRNPAVAVTLKRAVAKVTLVEADEVKIADDLALTFSGIYPQFNVLEGGASGTPASWTKTIKPAATTGPLATFYFLAKAEPQLTELVFVYAADDKKTVSNIPFQQNYATSIKGEYSSIGMLHFNVTTSEEWGSPDNEVEFPANVMRLTINTTKNTANTSDKTVVLPMAGILSGYDLTVDWGDGTSDTFTDGTTLVQADMTHEYPSAGEYTITITSSQEDPTELQMPKLDFYNNYSSTNKNSKKLISLDSPLLNMGADLSSCFDGCTNLTAIPANLFAKNTAATNFTYCFSDCTGLTGEIPELLFAKNTLATDFSKCFRSCTGLTEIPATLFANNTEAITFSGCFQGCTGLKGEIPAGLFAENIEATTFEACFSGCTKLTKIPAGLFEKNTEATTFAYCFYGCTKLVLNANIFCDETVENKGTRFAGKVMNFNFCFINCGSDASVSAGQGGTAPALWEYAMTSSTKSGCFRNVTKVTNVGEILIAWGGPKQ